MKITNLNEKKDKSIKRVSLCYKLEAIIGNYYLAGAGLDDIETLYYDSDMEIDDSIPLSKDKIVAYFLENESIAFVRMDLLTKLKADTEEYNIKYIPVKSFEAEVLNKKLIDEYFDILRDIKWIDDGFLNDDSIEFDYEAFEIIESGIVYLNPKHFSVNQLISVLNE